MPPFGPIVTQTSPVLPPAALHAASSASIQVLNQGVIQVAVAGGFVRNALIKAATTVVDIDCFIIAKNAAQALRIIETIIRHVQSNMVIVSYSVSMSALSLYCKCRDTAVRQTVQIITTPYPSAGAALRHFDLTPCCLGYIGNSFVTTPACGFYLDTG